MFKVNMTPKFLFMKNVNSSVLISNFDIKLSKTKPFFRYSHLKIKFLHKKVSGDLGRIFGLVTLSVWVDRLEILAYQRIDTHKEGF